MGSTRSTRSLNRGEVTTGTRQAALRDFIRGAEPQYLGARGSAAFADDPKHLVFLLARYKFVAKMLQGYGSVLEVGCGDGFGSTLVAQSVQQLTCIDVDAHSLDRRAENRWLRQKARMVRHDIVAAPIEERFEAVYALDVIEHIAPQDEGRALQNIVASSADDGVAIIGTPNEAAAGYASRQSQTDHVNLKSYDSLKQTMERFYTRVFMFGMNDEVLHTGFGPMCHYLIALGVRPRQLVHRRAR